MRATTLPKTIAALALLLGMPPALQAAPASTARVRHVAQAGGSSSTRADQRSGGDSARKDSGSSGASATSGGN